MSNARGLLGIAVLILIAWALSSDRRRFPIKTVLGGLALQWGLALLVLKTEPGRAFFDAVATVVTVILSGADEGAKFVFGHLASDGPVIAGVKIMSTIIVVATLSSLGYHYGILQRVVRGMAWVMTRALGVTGPESLSGAANVFLGQTEAPLLVRPFLAKMSRSELMAVMTGGFATISAGVMAYYVTVLGQRPPLTPVIMARHLMTASLMSAPAAFIMAKIMIPPGEEARPGGHVAETAPIETKNGLDAAATGAAEGMKLSINVLAMLVAFIGLVTIVDKGLMALGDLSFMRPMVHAMGAEHLNLDSLLGLLFSPVAWVLGVESGDCRMYGGLLGKAMATNEMIAYRTLGEIAKEGAMTQRSIIMVTYSLCGFANFSSIGIQIGGIGSLAPERRGDLVRLGPRAMLAGAMASWMTGCIAGMLI
ncbi:MAG: nucleoside transporter C-terminal domain-containing protein [Planctomycetota bacterium]